VELQLCFGGSAIGEEEEEKEEEEEEEEEEGAARLRHRLRQLVKFQRGAEDGSLKCRFSTELRFQLSALDSAESTCIRNPECAIILFSFFCSQRVRPRAIIFMQGICGGGPKV
jgi:hypothetical protein